MNTLLSFGHGYSAAAFADRLLAQGWTVIGTTRNPAKQDALRAKGIEPLLWDDAALHTTLPAALARATHILASAAPDGSGDPFLHTARAQIATARPAWVGYLSTTAVYGDHKGGWVTEETPVTPQSARAVARVLAERQWLALGLPVHVFRLAGIYGPGRGPFEKVRDGTARRILKAGQVFSRIHVDDIANVLLASVAKPNPQSIYNVCDTLPAPPEDVLAHAAALLGLPPPPTQDFETAEMSPMARSFYDENKRVNNDKLQAELGVTLSYPTYREGLAAILAQES